MSAGAMWILGLAALPLVGTPLLAHPAYRELSAPCRVVLAGLVGAVLLSVVMLAETLIGWRWNVVGLLASAAVLAAALRAALGRAGVSSAPRAARPRMSALERAGAAVMAVGVASAAAATVAGSATSGDLLLFWGPKAQQFALSRGIDAAFLRDPLHLYLHASYPPLVTDVYALCTMIAGRFAWGAAALTFPLGVAVLAVGLPGALALAAPRPRAFAVSALTVVVISAGGAAALIAGNGETALLITEAMAMALLIGPAAKTRPGAILTGLLLAGAALAKVEGAAFVACAVAACAAIRKLSPRSAALLLAPSAVSLGLWFAFGAREGLFSGYGAAGPLFEVHWTRLPGVTMSAARVLAARLLGLPYALPVLVLLAVRGKTRETLVPVATALGLSVCLLFTYLHGVEDPMPWIRWSADRVFLSVALLFCLAAAPVRGALES